MTLLMEAKVITVFGQNARRSAEEDNRLGAEPVLTPHQSMAEVNVLEKLMNHRNVIPNNVKVKVSDQC